MPFLGVSKHLNKSQAVLYSSANEVVLGVGPGPYFEALSSPFNGMTYSYSEVTLNIREMLRIMQRILVLLQSKFNSIVTQFQDRWIEIEKHNYNYLYVRSPKRCLSLFHPASKLSDAYAMPWHIPSLHRSVVSG